MNILGIIAEYNPFHNGHLYHLNQAKARTCADYVIVAMSGHFMQRGAPACFSKWLRAKMALSCGADLVLELPVDFAMASAERFAYGGVYLLSAVGATHLGFGAESELKVLGQAAELFASETEDLKSFLKQGLSFPVARQKAYQLPIHSPNDILAVEYLKACRKLRSPLVPVAVSREQCGYHDRTPSGSFASATAIRERFKNGQDASFYLPSQVAPLCQSPILEHLFDKPVLCALQSQTARQLSETAGVREGLENRLLDSAYHAQTVEELVGLTKSKRYTYTAISRMVYAAFLGLTQSRLADHPHYARILGISPKGRELLRNHKQNCTLPFVNKPMEIYKGFSEDAVQEMELDFHASDLYFTCAGLQRKGRADLTTSPIIL